MSNTEADLHTLKAPELTLLMKEVGLTRGKLKKEMKRDRLLTYWRSLQKPEEKKRFQDRVSQLRRGPVLSHLPALAAIAPMPHPSLYPLPPLDYLTPIPPPRIRFSPFYEVCEELYSGFYSAPIVLSLKSSYPEGQGTILLYFKITSVLDKPLYVTVNQRSPVVKNAHKKHRLFLFDITSHMELRPNNIINIATQSAIKGEVVIQRVRKIPLATLAQAVRDKSIQSASQPKTADNAPDDLVATSVELDLTCPLSMTRIREPCRPKQCKHTQCFDLMNFLELFQKAALLECSVCGAPLTLDQLVIDPTFQGYLDNTAPNVPKIILEADGTWKVPATVEGDLSQESPTQGERRETQTQTQEPIVIDSSDDEDSDDEGDHLFDGRSSSEPDTNLLFDQIAMYLLHPQSPPQPQPQRYLIAPISQAPEVISLDSDSE